MIKAVLLSLLVLLIVLLWRSNRRSGGDEGGGLKGQSQPAPPVAPQPTLMVRCQVCGLHLARTDAIVAPSGNYCSDSHYRQGQP